MINFMTFQYQHLFHTSVDERKRRLGKISFYPRLNMIGNNQRLWPFKIILTYITLVLHLYLLPLNQTLSAH